MLTIRQNQSGSAYTVVKTKRGPRARQISRGGLRWLRTKFPVDQYPSLEDIPFDYDLYRELRERGDVHTRSDRRAWRKSRRSTRNNVRDEMVGPTLFDNVPPANHRQQGAYSSIHAPPISSDAVRASETLTSAPAQAVHPPTKPAARCQSCGFGLADGAHFCSRCGRASNSGGVRRRLDLGWLWWVIGMAVAVVSFAIWHK